MIRFLKILTLLILISCYWLQSRGQAKPNITPAPKTGIIPDTIIYETKPAKEKKETEILHLYEAKKTIIKLPRNNALKIDSSGPKNRLSKDTQYVVKKGSVTNNPAKLQKANVLPYCDCIKVELRTDDTVLYGQYINYNILFSNHCNDVTYIYSAGFKVTPFNISGQKVKVLNQLNFVKRFDIPEYVTLNPKDSFVYRFADDLFFEFDLRKYELYKFVFTYSNTKNLSKTHPKKTYLCTENKDKMIFVR